ncbi:MAG: YIP1 family protein [Deltaproteobacteria bacterium]|nr:YIP1 family protein [Deltaproteobacteria bacterium]
MNMIERGINILVKPTTEWNNIKKEKWTIQNLFVKYAMILAAIPAVAGFIGQSVIGVSFFGATFRQPPVNGIIFAVLSYILALGTTFLMAFIIDALAPTFGAVKNMEDSLKIVVFANTAAWVAGIFAILPALGILAFGGSIYSLVLLYFGMKSLKNPPKDKMVGYYVVTLIIWIVIAVIAAVVVGAIALTSVGAGVATDAAEAFKMIPRS